MLNAFNEHDSPYMRGDRLPSPLTVHAQVTAQVLDELGVGSAIPVRSPTVGHWLAAKDLRLLNKASATSSL